MDGKGILGHITDTERHFYVPGNCGLRAADQTPASRIRADDYVRSGGIWRADTRGPGEEDLEPYAARASACFVRSRKRSGRGAARPMRKEVTVRALAFITAGHQMHHRIILEER